MKLKKIKIKNLKSFSEKEVKFSDITIFSGLNSAGKSSIINSLLLPMQLESNGKLFFNGIYFNLGTLKDIFHQWASDDELRVDYYFSNKTTSLSLLYKQSIEDNDHIFCEYNDYFSEYKKKIKYISAERISPKIFFKGDTPDSDAEFIGVNGELCVSVLSTLKNSTIPIEKMRHEKSGSYKAPASSLLANVNAWLDTISPNTTINPDLLSKIRISTLGFGYENDTTMNSVSSVNVGFGLTYVLPVIVSGLLCRKGDILIIENPEAHLHPAGQRHIGEFLALLAENGVQVVLETHSDHIMNGIRLSIKNGKIKNRKVKFIFVSKNEHTDNSQKKIESDVSYITLTEQGKIKKAPQGFFDEWEEALYQLL